MAFERNKPCLAMLFVQCLYAGMALFSKAAINKGMNPHVFVTYRQAFATTALAPFAFFLHRKQATPLSYNILWKIFLLSLFGTTLSLNLYYYAINYTSATFAAATTNTIPITTFIMALILRMESVSIKEVHGMLKVMGSAFGVCGALVFALVKGPPLIKFMNGSTMDRKDSASAAVNKSISEGEWVKGSLLMLLANTIWSFWLVMQASVVKQYPEKLRLATLQCFFSCLQTSVWAMAVERDISSWKLKWDVNLVSVLYCGVVVTGMTYWLQLWTIEKRGPVFTAIFNPLSLVLTALCSAFLWKENLHLGSVCGSILLIGGLYCVLWGKKKETEVLEADTEQQPSSQSSNKLEEC